MNDLPFGIILFTSDLEFSQICAFCQDFDFDVLELSMNNYPCLAFFVEEELEGCIHYCNIMCLECIMYFKL